jgi:hypothetical protein
MSLPLSQDNEHNLIMKPGDMVLYESAKLLHGRPGRCCGKCACNVRCFRAVCVYRGTGKA